MQSAQGVSPKLTFTFIQPETLPDVWGAVRGLVQAACDGSSGKYVPADIIRLLASRHMQLWIVSTEDAPIAAVMTEIAVFPQRKVCRLLACTGEDFPSWLGFLDEIEAWARGHGCSAIEPLARPGWKRILKARGYAETHVILEKPL